MESLQSLALSLYQRLSNMIPGILKYLQLLLVITSAHQCKHYPGDPGWPNATTWLAFNDTVSGRLTVPNALGSICHSNSPAFNNATCFELNEQWPNTSFVADNPYLADYNDESCPPSSANTSCTTAGYPAYIISATNAADVQAGINFARDHNIRLIVKGTGHDFPGRSSGSGSLSIYTHNIRGMTMNMHDSYALRYGGIASVTIPAGHQMRDVYTFAAANNITIVGGADPNVGIGGWILNGGHSPLSSLYGLGADQILSLEVVTEDGAHLTVNETSHSDLFWALRGGGGSTFAVMISVTVKAYPRVSVPITQYSFATAANTDTFWSMLAYFHAHIPRISEAGGMGYHYLVHGSSVGMPDVDIIAGAWFFPTKTVEQMTAVLKPLSVGINTSSWAVDPIYQTANTSIVPDAMAFLALAPGETAGVSGRLGSWLLDGPSLTGDFEKLKEGLKAAVPRPWNMISHVVAGPGVRNAVATIPGGGNAVLPAWRKAYTHIVLPRVWPADPNNNTLKSILTIQLREQSVPALKALAPSSGAYVNEADPTNPEWKHDYFGENYDRLLSAKKKYDPAGLFWCKPCVGWDEWDFVPVREEDKALPEVEWGVGQMEGRLCRKQ